jgi:ATP-dependent DNA helicase RecG
MIEADSEIRFIKGVGQRRAEGLGRLGYKTVEDLLYVMPFRYEDRRSFARIIQLRPAAPECSLAVTVTSTTLIRTRRRGFTIFKAMVTDESGSILAIWYNQPYLERVLTEGRRVVLYGKTTIDRGNHLVLDNPEYEILDETDDEGVHTGRIVPVYRKLGELTSRVMRQVVHRMLDGMAPESLAELVPRALVTEQGLLSRYEAIRAVHFPPSDASLTEFNQKRSLAQRTLGFEEMFLLQLALSVRRHEVHEEARGIAYNLTDALRTRLATLLPFKLTAAQSRVLKEIGADLRSVHPMHRLLQGDVGSGKTIVALLTLMVALENGYQAALMAPTEILAEQHFRTIGKLLERHPEPPRMVLLTGSLRAAARRETLGLIESGAARLIVGTHALFETGVTFDSLGLAVVDEQHRFGVLQRAALAEKGSRPDLLVMTATPIPRSLALTVYGDLDLSVIDELPPGRTPVKTVVRAEEDRAKVYKGLRQEIAKGRQVYIVVPLVDESEKSDLKAAISLAASLQQDVFPGLEVGLVHGRLKGEEKDAVMQRFTAGDIQILVATTVIEVGVDVPNATLMVVEHAERFGLSQLHQLRGRVGRGSERSYCVLMVGDREHGEEARERLAVMESTNDGFVVAEKDLEIRGPGVIFGTRQHGLSDLQFLTLVLRTPALLDAARAAAQSLVSKPASRKTAVAILKKLGARWQKRLSLAEVG